MTVDGSWDTSIPLFELYASLVAVAIKDPKGVGFKVAS